MEEGNKVIPQKDDVAQIPLTLVNFPILLQVDNRDRVDFTDAQQVYEVVKKLCELYPELLWLANGNQLSTAPTDLALSISKLVFGQAQEVLFDEFEKTILSICCILWAMGDENGYTYMTRWQAPATVLSRGSWNQLQNDLRAKFTCFDAQTAANANISEQQKILKDFQTKTINVSPQARQVKLSTLRNENLILKKNFSNDYYDINTLPNTNDTDKAISDGAEALIVYTILADLGRVEYIRRQVRDEGIEEVDTHKIVLMALKTNPKLFPSYQRLGENYQSWILEGLQADFNFAQMIQAELVPGKLPGLKEMRSMAFDLFNFQGLFDLAAGAAVAPSRSGLLYSNVLNELTYSDTEVMAKCIKLALSESQIYNQYLNCRARKFRYMDSSKPTQRAIIRICCHLRFHEPEGADIVIGAWEKLSEAVRKNMEKEMAVTGIDGTWAILVYFAPKIMTDMIRIYGNTADTVKVGIEILNKIYVEARKRIQDQKGSGVFTVSAGSVCDYIGQEDPIEEVSKAKIVVVPYGKHGITNVIKN